MITVEKLLILKDVGLFRYTSNEILLDLAYVVEEQLVLANQVIINKGDFGKDMFIIAQGQVKVHDGDVIIALLGEREVFGELAALAPETRIASVTTTQNTTLLRVSHDILYDLMARNIGLAQGIIEVLCNRARNIAHTQK